MSVKKIFAMATAAVAAIGVSSAFGAGQVPNTPPAPPPQQGFFLGFSLGWGDSHWSQLNGNEFSKNVITPGGINGTVYDITSVSSNSGFAWGVTGGYQFNQYLGGEVDYVDFRNASITDNTYTFKTPGSPITHTTVTNSYKVKEYGVGIFGRITVPLLDTGANLFAKVGLSYLNASAGGAVGNPSHWGPGFGFGANYMFNHNIVAGVSWTRYDGNGNLTNKNYIPKADFVSFNLGYFFNV